MPYIKDYSYCDLPFSSETPQVSLPYLVYLGC